MSTERNKALVRRMLEEVFGRGQTNLIEEFVAPDFVEREELPAGLPRSREGGAPLVGMLHRAFPDLEIVIGDVIAEGDKVVMGQRWNGTHKGEFMGIPATGKRMSTGVIDIVRIADGRVVEHWGQMDGLGLMQQLGAVPAPG